MSPATFLPFLKCNCDAAIFANKEAIGLRMVIHDKLGQFLACRQLSVLGFPEAKECESFVFILGHGLGSCTGLFKGAL